MQVLGIVEGSDSAGVSFFGIVMPRMDCSLRDELNKSTVRDIRRVLQWLKKVALTLSKAHEFGVVHGDVKVGCVKTIPDIGM